MNLSWVSPYDTAVWVMAYPLTYTTDSTTSWGEGGVRPSKWERQRERFYAQLARRRGRMLAAEVEGMLR